MSAVSDLTEITTHASRDHLRIACVFCASVRKLPHQRIATLSIDRKGDRWVYYCHHCSTRGQIPERMRMPIVPAFPHNILSSEATKWLSSRGITTANPGLAELRMIGGGIGFPYTNGRGAPYAWKVRSLRQKQFWCQGAPQTFFSPAPLGEDVIITEGEIDALSFLEAGIPAISVPNGAPQEVSNNRTSGEDRRLRCVWTARESLEKAKRILIATDADGPGDALAEELARRVGKHKCFRVRYPIGCKDANEVLVKQGREAVAQLIINPEPWPISGLHLASDFAKSVEELYENGLPRGVSTGWPKVDEYMTVKEGMLYVITGIPSHGKSTWLDALVTNLGVGHGWKTAFSSFENPISIHIAKLCAQYVSKPFGFHGERMTRQEMQAALDWVNQHFMFCSQEGELPTVSSILDRFKVAVLRKGVRACVLDPVNFIRFPGKDSDGPDTEAVNQMLAEFKVFATAHDVAFFLIAHPAKKPMGTGSTWIPTGYAISGSAHYYNRPDFGITVYRPQSYLSEIHVWKARFNHLGKHGHACLTHNPVTGQFHEAKEKPKLSGHDKIIRFPRKDEEEPF